MKLRFNRPLDARLKSIVEKRNLRPRCFFTSKNLDVELTEDAENPMIVVGQSISIAAYVKNFDLLFLDKSFMGIVKRTFKLTKEIEGTREKIIQLMKHSVHVGLFRIQEKKQGSIWQDNFKDPENRKGSFPFLHVK